MKNERHFYEVRSESDVQANIILKSLKKYLFQVCFSTQSLPIRIPFFPPATDSGQFAFSQGSGHTRPAHLEAVLGQREASQGRDLVIR
jgi:hypothetical protein